MKRFENYTSGIYFIFQRQRGNDVLCYIGKSTNIFSRVYQHGTSYFDYCKYLETINNAEVLNFTERWLIWILHPKWNIAGNTSQYDNRTVKERFERFCLIKEISNKPKRLTLETISKFVYATALERVRRGA